MALTTAPSARGNIKYAVPSLSPHTFNGKTLATVCGELEDAIRYAPYCDPFNSTEEDAGYELGRHWAPFPAENADLEKYPHSLGKAERIWTRTLRKVATRHSLPHADVVDIADSLHVLDWAGLIATLETVEGIIGAEPEWIHDEEDSILADLEDYKATCETNFADVVFQSEQNTDEWDGYKAIPTRDKKISYAVPNLSLYAQNEQGKTLKQIVEVLKQTTETAPAYLTGKGLNRHSRKTTAIIARIYDRANYPALLNYVLTQLGREPLKSEQIIPDRYGMFVFDQFDELLEAAA